MKGFAIALVVWASLWGWCVFADERRADVPPGYSAKTTWTFELNEAQAVEGLQYYLKHKYGFVFPDQCEAVWLEVDRSYVKEEFEFRLRCESYKK